MGNAGDTHIPGIQAAVGGAGARGRRHGRVGPASLLLRRVLATLVLAGGGRIWSKEGETGTAAIGEE